MHVWRRYPTHRGAVPALGPSACSSMSGAVSGTIDRHCLESSNTSDLCTGFSFGSEILHTEAQVILCLSAGPWAVQGLFQGLFAFPAPSHLTPVISALDPKSAAALTGQIAVAVLHSYAGPRYMFSAVYDTLRPKGSKILQNVAHILSWRTAPYRL